ncbi:MAG: MmcQ/YjbR family DNA-binding protein [Clostridia bacterium]|nr:MmcQ/YjbR family DNA-binding protein [Clostridia bacterium]
MANVTPKAKKPNEKKLLAFGFKKKNGTFLYLRDLVEGQMRMAVEVAPDGNISATVTDKSTDEEYVLHRTPHAQGAFVGRVKAEYDAILDDIFVGCFDNEVFKSEQAKEIIAYVRDKYDDEFEYLWQKFPDNAIVRRKDNQKWYAALLTVSRRKLRLDSDENAEILDLRARPEDIATTVDHERYFPGYHMNKKHWITACLDGTIATEELCSMIDTSYKLAKK